MTVCVSHPTRVRGLKHGVKIVNSDTLVAPHTGAWIETSHSSAINSLDVSHPTRVRGLKRFDVFILANAIGRTPHGCVD